MYLPCVRIFCYLIASKSVPVPYNISANFCDKVLINRKILPVSHLLLKRPWSGLFARPADEIQKRKSVKGITAISCQSSKFVPIMSWKQCSGSGSVRSVCFGPPGPTSGSVIYLNGSGSGSFHQQAKKWRKNLICTVFWLLYNVNVPSKRNEHKNLEKNNSKMSRIPNTAWK